MFELSKRCLVFSGKRELKTKATKLENIIASAEILFKIAQSYNSQLKNNSLGGLSLPNIHFVT